MAKKFPDLTGDGKVTQADVLKGRGVFGDGGSIMVPPEREAYSKGGAVLDLVAAIVGKQTKAAKKDMVSKEKASQQLIQILDENPQALDDLSEDQYLELMDALPQSQGAKMGGSEAPINDAIEMARGMEPIEVAQNLEMFNDIDEIFEYVSTLNAKDSRQFMDNLSDEDLQIFAGELPDVGATLGPREVKNEGGKMDVAIILPPEYEEKMDSDEDMEEDYVDFVKAEILSQDEQEYLFKILDDDSRLEEILDKVILSASEFTGSGEVEGPGTGTSDSIPARLSDGEFVFTKKAVDHIGADKLQEMMENAEQEYDNGREGKAYGGMANGSPYNDPSSSLMTNYAMDKNIENQMLQENQQQQDDIQRQMIYASKAPSLLNQ